MAGKNKKAAAAHKNQSTASMKTSVLIIFFLLGFTALVIFLGVRYNVFSNPFGAKENLMQLQSIDTKIKSSTTGDEFYVSTDVTLAFENQSSDSQKNITQVVADAISNMDYDKITSSGNVSYIKESIINKLSDSYPSNAVTNIYITDFQSSRTPIDRVRKGTWDLLFPMQ